MTLLIDIGNTRLKVGYVDAQGIRQTQHSVALVHTDIDQLLPWLQRHHLSPKQAVGIYVASNTIAQKVVQLLSHINCKVQWIDATTPCPLLLNQYDQPEQLGADRWLALVGILANQPLNTQRPVIHASFGTATTIDMVLPADLVQSARFIGGLILPGPKLMYDSLALNTAKLGNGIGLIQDFPSNTRAAISSGIAAAQAGAVLRQWQLSYQKNQGVPLLVCSGGGWDLIQEEVKNAHSQRLRLLNLAPELIIEQPTPVLDGLNYMATHQLLPTNSK